ncbi:hypothetical protein KIW84_075506 [Lathyrus oleraceus]|uniref:PB1-like domain-containing protein n=1 Tax=Pisum sativum TaxID=3888 RepID=A0A9D4VTW9_PEA|nr:hypothetical protein KIW84_075506 [Pisum sativum]
MGLLKVVFYTKDSFVKDSTLRYEGGDRHAYNGQHYEYWSSFKSQDLNKTMDTDFNLDGVKIWWKHEGGSLEKDLKPFTNGEDASLLSLLAKKNKCEIEIYIDVRPSVKSKISKREKVNQVPFVKRKSGKLKILNTRNFVGPGKNSDDPLMILEEE